MVDLFRTKHWDLIKWRNWYFALSLLVILPGLFFWARQGFNKGIDFTGGGLITYQLSQPMSVDQAREAMRLSDAIKADPKGGENTVQIAGTGAGRSDQILVRTRIDRDVKDPQGKLDEQQTAITALLKKDFGESGVENAGSQLVSPVVSDELIKKAVWAVLWGCLFILLWVRIRYFDFKWAFSAVIALAHDVLVLLGVFAIFHQFEINSPFVAAALTMVGFSVHDTIIIFDRIRENLKLRKGRTFAETANISLLETLARSVNTVLTVVFVLVAVLIFGGSALRDFTFAMLVGVISGAYSSIFNASQILVVLKQREEASLARRRAAQAGRKGGAQARSATQGTVTPKPAPTPKPALETGLAEANGVSAAESAPADTTSDEEKARARKKMKASGKRKRRF